MISNRLGKVLGWTGIAIFLVAGIVDVFQLWEMRRPLHHMSMLALAIGSIALLKVSDTKDGGGAHG